MGTVRAHMSMSLDGFVAGPDVSLAHPMGVGGDRHAFKTEMDAEAQRAMFPQNERLKG